MKKIYIKPLAEFEEIEEELLKSPSKYDYGTEGSGTTDDGYTDPTDIEYGGETGGTGDDDPNG